MPRLANTRSAGSSLFYPRYLLCNPKSVDASSTHAPLRYYEDVRIFNIEFNAVKARVIDDLTAGRFQHEARRGVARKNMLQQGIVTPDAVIKGIQRCTPKQYLTGRHHRVPAVWVHLMKPTGWYIKFYVVEDATLFISVHW